LCHCVRFSDSDEEKPTKRALNGTLFFDKVIAIIFSTRQPVKE